jgi:hypothetical protein
MSALPLIVLAVVLQIPQAQAPTRAPVQPPAANPAVAPVSPAQPIAPAAPANAQAPANSAGPARSAGPINPAAAPRTPAAAPAVAAQAAGGGPTGFYILQATDKLTVPDESLGLPSVSGIAIRASWKEIEPEQGKFNWEYLDAQIGRAKRLGKKTQLIVYCGVWSPEWVYAAGVKSLSFSDHRKSADPSKMPIPWDPQLFTLAGKLFDELGRRYAAEPSLTAVHLSIVMRFSAEMHMPNELPAAPGYSSEKMVSAWQQAIGIENRAFPRTPLVLNLSQQPYADAVIAELRRVVGGRAVFQHDALAAKTASVFGPQQKILALHAAGARVGFEALGPSNQPRFGGPFSVACDKAIASGASYFNIYPYEPAHNAAVMAQYAGRFRP